jgi:serine protease
VLDTHRNRPKALVVALATLLAGSVTTPLLAQDSGTKHADRGRAAQLQPYYIRHAADDASQPPHARASFGIEQQVSAFGGDITHRMRGQNLIAVMLPPQAASALQNARGVELIEPVPEHRISAQVTPWNIDQFQARDIWDVNRDGVVDPGAPNGSGVKVCVIDTGFYAPHDDFQGMTVSGMSQISGESWTQDGNGHGTHVAGTVNAMNNNVGVVGVMPGGAELFIIKIFNNSGVWVAGQSNLGAAAIACKDAGANVISMSLGGGGSAAEQAIFQDLYDNHGILHVAAAGNSGNTVASFPASYPSVVSVAAIDENQLAAGFTQFPTTAFNPVAPPANAHWDVVEVAGGGVNVLSTWPGPPHGGVPAYQVSVPGNTFGGNHITNSGSGTATGGLVSGGLCTTGSGQASWAGKIVLCERGQVNFSEKVNTVRAAGGLAALIYNNTAGNFSGTCNTDCTPPLIPALSLSQADGQTLLAQYLAANTTVTADSGTGCTTCIGSYRAISGTSMATPGVAAGMGFIWDACGGPTSLTNKELRLLLRDSAKDLMGQQPAPGNQSYGAGWDRVTGWGLVQLKDAMDLGNERFGSACAIGIGVAPANVELCGATTSSTPFTLTLGDMFDGTAALSAQGLPAGASGSFSVNPVVHPDKESVYTVSGLGNVASGVYPISFEAVDTGNASNTAGAQASLSLFAAAPGALGLVAPANGATDQNTRPTLSWNSSSEAASYTLEVSTSAGFGSIVYTATVTGTTHTLPTPLAASTAHYWRLRANNVCGNGSWSAVRSFTTAAQYCSAPAVAIPDNNPAGVNDTIVVPSGGSILDLDVHLRATHTWVNDLVVTLTNVGSGSTVRLLNRPVTSGGAGCNGDNPNLIFDDQAAAAANTTCVNADPAWPIGARFRPVDPLSAFAGTDLSGSWTLNVSDRVAADTGVLEEWCLLPSLAVPTNTPPVANADAYATDRNVALVVGAAAGVLGNDTDPDGDALTALVASSTSNGSLDLAADGSFSYQPNSDFCGADSFTYVANDGAADSNVATASIDVACTNRAPIVSGSMSDRTMSEMRAMAESAAAAFTDPDGDILNFAMTGAPASLSIHPLTGAISGMLQMGDADGSPYTVVITATDPDGESAQTGFELTVLEFEPSIFSGSFESLQ